MTTSRAKTSFFNASIAPAFGIAAGFFKQLSSEIEDSNRSSASTAGSKTGQISAFRYDPPNLTHKQKIAIILKMIDNNELLKAPGKSLTDIAVELSSSDYEGKSIKGMIAELKSNSEFLLDDPKLKPAAPKPSFAAKPKLLALSFATA